MRRHESYHFSLFFITGVCNSKQSQVLDYFIEIAEYLHSPLGTSYTKLITKVSEMPSGPMKGPLGPGSCPHHMKQQVGGGLAKTDRKFPVGSIWEKQEQYSPTVRNRYGRIDR